MNSCRPKALGVWEAYQQEGPFGGPVSGAARAVLLPRQDEQRGAGLLVLLGSVKHVQLAQKTAGSQ